MRAISILSLLLLAAPAPASELKFVDTPEELVPMPVNAELQPLPEQEEEAPRAPPRREMPRKRLVKTRSLSGYGEEHTVRYYATGQLQPKAQPARLPADAGQGQGLSLPLPLAIMAAVVSGLGEPRRAGQPSGRLAERDRVSRDGRQRGLRRAALRLNNGRVASPLTQQALRSANRSEEAEAPDTESDR